MAAAGITPGCEAAARHEFVIRPPRRPPCVLPKGACAHGACARCSQRMRRVRGVRGRGRLYGETGHTARRNNQTSTLSRCIRPCVRCVRDCSPAYERATPPDMRRWVRRCDACVQACMRCLRGCDGCVGCVRAAVRPVSPVSMPASQKPH